MTKKKTPLSLKLTIYRDEDAKNPREDGRYASTLALWVKNQSFGDDIGGKSPREFIKEKLGEGAEIAGKSLAVLEKQLEKDYYYLPVFGTSHGGICFSTHEFFDPFDSGRAGIILISKKDAEEFKMNKKEVLEALAYEVEEYSSFLDGDVYSYKIEYGDRTFFGDTYYGILDDTMLKDMKDDAPVGFSSMFDLVDTKKMEDGRITVCRRARTKKKEGES